MDEISRILSARGAARTPGVPIPTDSEIAEAEAALRFRFPNSYRRFLNLGGLSQRWIHNRVLSPQQIVHSAKYLPDTDHIPFAENGTGDLYCWLREERPEPAVVLADHETAEYQQDSASFAEWLAKTRF
jgi:hypothetical protein